MVERACKKCKAIFEGSTCPKCGSKEHVDAYKGRMIIINPEQSEVAKQVNIKDKGEYAVKLG